MFFLDLDVHELIIDDEEGTACSNEIIFNLSGFAIRGDVRSGESSGPPNFKLGLYDATGKQIGTTVTKDGGSYEFFAKPGIVTTINEKCANFAHSRNTVLIFLNILQLLRSYTYIFFLFPKRKLTLGQIFSFICIIFQCIFKPKRV